MAEQSPAPGSGDDGVSSADDDAPGGTTDVEARTGVERDGSGDGGESTGVVEAGAEPGREGPRVVGLESADAADVIGAVGSDTARSVLEALHEESGTASGLADRVDCSLQTIQYHLGNLTDADLVDVVDTTTSPKGREMDVYAPARRPVVVYAGDEDDETDLRTMVRRLVPAAALLALASLVVQELLSTEPSGAAEGDAVTVSSEAAGQASGAVGPEPGLVFFAGGLLVLAAYVGWWQLRRRGYLDGRLPWA